MKNRLQFNRHYAEFQSREDALTALRARITDPDFIPLIGEPIVFRYKDENDNLQVILAIGKKAGHNLDERDYHVIDTADLDEKIAAEVAAREELDAETIKKVIFDGVESEFNDNVATLSVSANSIPIGAYEEYDGRANTPHPIHDDYSVLEAVKQVDTNFISFLNDTEAKVNGIHIVKVTSGLDANVREAYDLVNLSGYPQPNSERILIYKDSSLYKAYLGHTDDRLDDYTDPESIVYGTGDTALCFIYLKVDGTYQLVAVDVEEFLQENEFEDGLVVNNHIVKVKIDRASESFLTVGPDGVKLSGVQIAIDDAQQAEEDRAVAAEEAIQAELDATQAGAGLDTDGSYIHDHSTNYIDGATSLANADHLLDVALKDESDRATAAEGTLQDNIDAEESRASTAEATLQSNIDAEVTRATTAENTLQNNIDAEESRATAAETTLQENIDAEQARATEAENTLQSNIDTEVSARTDADAAIQAELDATQVGAGLAADGSYIHDHPTNYIDAATSLANADHLLDVALKTESDRAIAAENSISAATKNEIDRATAAESGLSQTISAEETRAQNAESALNSKISELSAGTESEVARLDNKIETETQRATSTEAILSGTVIELSANTVSEIARLDAAISSGNTGVDALSGAVVSEIARAQNAESALDSKISELSAGTVSEASRLDGKIDAETQRAETAEDAIEGKVDELSGITAAFSSATVSEIARIDAAVTRNKVKSTGHTIVVNEAAEGINLEANIDGKTILSNNGELKTGIKFISLPSSELEANVREAFKLADVQGTPIDNTTIKIYKSSSLVSLELINVGGTDYVRVTYIDNSGATQTMDLNIQQLVFEAEFKDGLTVNANHEVKVEIDPTSEAFLTVSSDGVKLSGVQNTIDTVVAAETARATAAENSISGDVATLSGATIAGLQYISGVTDNVINACGLNIGQQGGYVPHGNTPIISGASSLDQADVLLDQAVWALSGSVVVLSGSAGDVTLLEEKVQELSATTRSFSSNTVAEINSFSAGTVSEIEALKTIISANTGVTALSAATVNLSAATVDINNRLTAVEAAIIENSGVTQLSAATINLSSATVYIEEHMTGEYITINNYEVASGSGQDLVLESGDTVNTAFGKIQKQILDNEEVIAAGFNDLNDRLSAAEASISANTGVTALSAATVTLSGDVSNLSAVTVNNTNKITNLSAATVTLSGNVTNLSAATVHISGDVTSLSAATVTLSGDVSNLSGAVMSISAKTSGVLTLNLNSVEQGKYSPSASTSIDVRVTGANVPLSGYQIASGRTLEELIVESGDTVNEAFGKVQKQIYDNELVVAGAFNDINDRILELSGRSMDPSEYYTKQEVNELLPTKQFSTASSLTNITFAKYLTVATISNATVATLSITQNASIISGWGLSDGEVMEARVIVKNDNSSSLTVTLPTAQSDSRVRNVGGSQLSISPNGFGEVNVMITRDGNNYVIYLTV